MKKHPLYFILVFLFPIVNTFSQSFLVSKPELKFDGKYLYVSYDIINKKQSDHFFVWMDMEKKNGESIQMKALSGDIGPEIKSGSNKQIIWNAEKDAVILNEEVFVELKAEKYVRSFNKGSAMLLSTVFPGLGQTKISNGKPWWIMGVAAYGAVAGGVIFNQVSVSTYDSYKTELDPVKRASLYNKTQQQLNLSSGMIISGAALWAVNVFWIALKPNRYEPLKYLNLSLEPTIGLPGENNLLSFKVNF